MIIFRQSLKRPVVVVAIMVLIFTITVSCSAFAADSSTVVETTFFGNLKDDGQGCGVFSILNLVVDILSIGIGIVGVIGIIVVGIQYLTAGGNEQQTAKARRRMFEIVLGIVAYVVLYTFIQWLLPGGKLNTTTCQTVTDEQLSEIKAQEAAEKASQSSKSPKSNTKDKASSTPKLSSQIAQTYTPTQMAKLIKKGKTAPSPVCTNCTWSKRIAQTAMLLSWPKGTAKSKYHYTGSVGGRNYKKWSDMKGAKPNPAYQTALDKVRPDHSFSSMSALGADCGNFVNTVLRYSGHDRKMPYGSADGYFSAHKWKKVKKAQPGDICVTRGDSSFHIWINLGGGLRAEANHYGQNFGHIAKGGCGSATAIWRAT